MNKTVRAGMDGKQMKKMFSQVTPVAKKSMQGGKKLTPPKKGKGVVLDQDQDETEEMPMAKSPKKLRSTGKLGIKKGSKKLMV